MFALYYFFYYHIADGVGRWTGCAIVVVGCVAGYVDAAVEERACASAGCGVHWARRRGGARGMGLKCQHAEDKVVVASDVHIKFLIN